MELKEIIDQRTPEERKWMTAYLLDEMFSVPELRQSAQELSELTRRRGRNPMHRSGPPNDRVYLVEEVKSVRIIYWLDAFVREVCVLRIEPI